MGPLKQNRIMMLCYVHETA
jgi:hypothetical protein